MTARLVFGLCGSWRQLNSRLDNTKKSLMPSVVSAFGLPSYRRLLFAEKRVNKLNPVEESMRAFSTEEKEVQNLDPVFDAPLFKASITRERKRTDRSGRAM